MKNKSNSIKNNKREQHFQPYFEQHQEKRPTINTLTRTFRSKSIVALNAIIEFKGKENKNKLTIISDSLSQFQRILYSRISIAQQQIQIIKSHHQSTRQYSSSITVSYRILLVN